MKLTTAACAGLLAAGLAVGASSLAQTDGRLRPQLLPLSLSGVPQFRILRFEQTKDLPRFLSEAFVSYVNSLHEIDAQNTTVLVSYTLMNARNKALFVRLESPLTCAASGQCETSLFLMGDGGGNLRSPVMSATVENIGVSEGYERDPERMPPIVTNVPYQQISDYGTANVEGGTIWYWMGDGYRVGGGR